MKNTSKFFLLLALSMALFNSNSWAAEIRVIGAGSNEKSSAGTYSSIQAALHAARPGDTIVIEEGVYFENATLSDFGIEEKWTTIKAREGADVVIDGSRANEAALLIRNSQYITVEGIHFTNANKYGLAFFDSHHVRAQRCRASYNQWEGFLAFNASHSEFIDCIGHDNVHDSFNFNNAKDSVMRGSLQFRGGNGLSVEQGSQNILIEDNIFYDNWADGILVYTQCRDIVIKNNLIFDIHYNYHLDNGQGHCIKVTHGNDNVEIAGNKMAQCAAAFAYEIAGNGNVTYNDNVLAEIGGRIPVAPKMAWDNDVLYKGAGEPAEFHGCRWYSIEELEQKGWGQGNRMDGSILAAMKRKISELKESGVMPERNNEDLANK